MGYHMQGTARLRDPHGRLLECDAKLRYLRTSDYAVDFTAPPQEIELARPQHRTALAFVSHRWKRALECLHVAAPTA